MKQHLVVPLFFIALGTIIATGAVPVDGPSDELDATNDTGIYLTPADTPNGDRYAGLDDEGRLTVEVAVVTGTETRFDDVVTVSFDGFDSSDSAAEVWIEQDEDTRISFYRMDEDEQIDGEDNAIQLDPGESVNIGFVVDATADVQPSFTETITYRVPGPGTDDTSSDDDDSGGSSGGGNGGGSSGTDDDSGSSDDDTSGGSSNTGNGSGSAGDDNDSGSSGSGSSEETETELPDDGTTEQIDAVTPEVTLGGFFFKTLLMLIAFIISGAGLFRMIRNSLE